MIFGIQTMPALKALGTMIAMLLFVGLCFTLPRIGVVVVFLMIVFSVPLCTVFFLLYSIFKGDYL